MIINFGTKAETLERLAPVLTTAKVLPIFRFTKQDWELRKNEILENFETLEWSNAPVIIRSSATDEDSVEDSKAGHYTSIGNIQGGDSFIDAVNLVISSFEASHGRDQVFVQPYLTETMMSGVAFSTDPNTGAPYIIINYNDQDGDTSVVTAGKSNNLRTFICSKIEHKSFDPQLNAVIDLVFELESLFESISLDIEFAIDRDGFLILFQVRPLMCDALQVGEWGKQQSHLSAIEQKINEANRPHPYLFGERTLFGIMPDWNPAEIVGIRPRPLALSLYKELVTDSIWAYQRNNYGYKNLRSFPLLVSFHGLPYIDVRVSFNSFIPRVRTH